MACLSMSLTPISRASWVRHTLSAPSAHSHLFPGSINAWEDDGRSPSARASALLDHCFKDSPTEVRSPLQRDLLPVLTAAVGMYVVARILLGFGIPFCIVAGSAMLGELGHPKERPILTSLFNSSYFIGSIVAASVGLATVNIKNDWAWRIPSLLQIAPALVQIVAV